MPAFHEEIVRRIESGEDPLTFESHLADCRACRNELAARLAPGIEREVPQALVDQMKRIGESPLRPRNVSRWSWPVAAAAAAVIMFTALAVRDRFRPAAPPAETLRAPAGTASSVELVFPSDSASLPAGAVTFRWSPVLTAKRYTLRLLDAKGAIVSEAATATESVVLELPPADGAAYWYVTAHLEDGRIVESATRALQVVPRAAR